MEVERFEWKGYKKTRKIGKLGKVIFILAIILILTIIITTFLTHPLDLSSFSPTQPQIENVISDISIEPARKINTDKYLMTIGEESTIQFSFSVDKSGKIASLIELPAGVQYISGRKQMNVTANKNVPNNLTAYIRAVKVGKWEVKGMVIIGNKTFEKSFELCIDVLEDKARERCL